MSKPLDFQIPKADIAPSGAGPKPKYKEPVQTVSKGKIRLGKTVTEVRQRDVSESVTGTLRRKPGGGL